MKVVVDGEASSSAPVVSGVPQGTVLGPLLFLIYINDMPNVVSEGTFIRLFADDCLVYRYINKKTAEQDQLILQRDLQSLHEWTVKWGMKFNPSKCQIMHLSRAQEPYTKFYELCGEILESVESAKYLGLTISDDLKWHTNKSAPWQKRPTRPFIWLVEISTTARNQQRQWPTPPSSVQKWSIVQLFGTPIPKRTLTSWKRSTDELPAW